ncbi:amidohydrolase family protein [Candidatus Poribacteria bacterium]
MVNFFDCNCVIGMRGIRRAGVAGEAEFYSIEGLMAEMDYAGIGDALVYHSLAKEYVPMLGNRQLMDEINCHERLHPCWVVMPHGTGEMPHPEALVNEMIEQDVKAARLFPSDHLFSLSDWCSGELLTQLEKHGIVVIIQMDQIGWDGLHGLCSRYPDLSVIITNLSYRINRYLYPLLEKFKNVYVETSGYQIHKGMETLCAKFGAERIIFGTRMPSFTPGPAVNMINYSLISSEEKGMIAGGNLRRLLGVGRTHGCAPTEASDIKETAALGRALEGELVIDSHTHMGPYFNFHIPDNDAGSMMEVMDRLGVNLACTSPHVGITPEFRMGNDMAAQAVQDHPGRFFGYITINGNYPDDIPEEIERCYSMGMRGFKIHPSLHGYPANGENLRPMWEFADEKGLPVLSHTWAGDGMCSPGILGKLAEEYTNAQVILGHSGGTLAGYDEAVEVAKKQENVFLETCSSSVVYGMIERFVREVGADRILFGSDMPFVNANAQIGKILYAKIPDQDKRKILGLNMAGIIGL